MLPRCFRNGKHKPMCSGSFYLLNSFLSKDFIQSFQLSCRFLSWAVGWLLVVLRINVDLAIFQPYLDLEAGDNQSLKIQVARPGIEPRSSCSASQELNHLATAAPLGIGIQTFNHVFIISTYQFIQLLMDMMESLGYVTPSWTHGQSSARIQPSPENRQNVCKTCTIMNPWVSHTIVDTWAVLGQNTTIT